MKPKNPDKTVKSFNHGTYILIDEVEAHLTESVRETIYRKMRSLFKNQQECMECEEEYEVTIFVASDKSVDEKINEINKRIIKKS